jgi:hypothetical protein
MMQMFGQMMMMPFSMFACWMNMMGSALRCVQPQGWQGQDVSNRYGNAPGMGSPETGSYTDNQRAQGDGATEAKEERKMSDCCCCDDKDQTVKLIEYTIVSIKRCDERILYKGEIIDAQDMGDEAFATWVVALYLQEPNVHVPHEDKRYLRVYHRVLESWARVEKDCCGDQQVDVLRGIERAIRELTAGRREEYQAPAPA